MVTTETVLSAGEDQPPGEKRMSLAGHLIELRKRLVISAIGVVVGMVIAFIFAEFIIDILTQPILDVADERGKELVNLNFGVVTGAFDLRIRISFVLGLLLSAPVWLSQIWLFIMPGLTKKEIRYTVGFIGAAIPLFFAGCYVGWLIVPHMIQLLSSFTPDGAAQFLDYSYYYDFVLKMLLVIGVAFVLPVFLVLLNFVGVISGMGILKGWRVAILVITIFAAMATPAADVTSMLILAGIMVVLYFAAAGVSLLFDRRRAKRQVSFLPPEADA